MPSFILVAEDDPFLGETVRLSLLDHDVRVVLVGDGEQAIAALDKEQPDVLLLDLLMPKKDGLAVLQHIKERQYVFPIIILSNLSGDMTPEKCFALGAKDYLVKSDMDEEELWPCVQKYLPSAS
jgi:two-component system response regulator RstA